MLGQRSLIEDSSTSDDWEKHAIAMFGEFVGTTSFLWLAFAAQTFAAIPFTSVANNGNVNNPGNVLYVALAFAFSYAVNIWIFYPIGGGFFNPAVTLGLILVDGMSWIRGFLLVIMQFAGGIVAAFLVLGMFPYALRASTILNPECNLAQGVFIEAFLTTLLVLIIIILATERTRTAILAPVGIGLALFVIQLAGIFSTGASVNPARSLGPAVATLGFGRYHWIYYVGPLIGSLLAVALFKLMKLAGYRAFASEEYLEEELTMRSSKETKRSSKELQMAPYNVGTSLV